MLFETQGSFSAGNLKIILNLENAEDLVTLLRLANLTNTWVDMAQTWLRGYGGRLPYKLFEFLLKEALENGILTSNCKAVKVGALKRRRSRRR